MNEILLNIGSGNHNLPGFINIDIEPFGDIQTDISLGLPFADNSISGIFSEHFIEHLSQAEGIQFLRECRRVLVPGGRLRLATPDLDYVVELYSSEEWLSSEMAKHGYDWIHNPAEQINISMREWGHKWLYNETELFRLGDMAGLQIEGRYDFGNSADPRFNNLEYRAGSRLVVEFTKRSIEQPEKPPLVSILIPAYRPNFFEAALDSAISQTYSNTEIIITDDSTDDAIREIIKSYSDARVHYYQNPEHLGGRKNYIRCFGLARGDYIKFLNDDDVLHPHCVERMAKTLDAYPEVTLVTSRRQLIDENNQSIADQDINRRLELEDVVIDGVSLSGMVLHNMLNFVGEPSTVMFRRRDLESTTPDLFSFAGRTCITNGDVTMWVNLLSRGHGAYLTDTLSYFRIHAQQRTKDADYQAESPLAWEQIRFDAQRMGMFSPDKWHPIKSISMEIKPWWPVAVQNMIREALGLMHSGDYESALNYVEQAIETDPTEKILHTLASRILRKLGDAQRALDFVTRALVLDNNYIPARIEFGLCSGHAELSRTYHSLCNQLMLFRQGFYAADHAGRWMAVKGEISLPPNLLQVGVEVSLKLTCSDRKHYNSFPFNVNISIGGQRCQSVTFNESHQTKDIILKIPANDRATPIILDSDQAFVPEKKGINADRRVLSVLIGDLTVKPENQEQIMIPPAKKGLEALQENWNLLGKTDPLWAILSVPEMKNNQWDVEEFFRTGRIAIDRVVGKVRELNPSQKYNRALDFGCGVGRLTQALCSYFDRCDGVDIAPEMVRLANEHNQFGDHCHYHVNSGNSLHLFDDNSFDLIYSAIVLQHIPPQYSKDYLREFLRVLAPGGLLIFQLPSHLQGMLVKKGMDWQAFKASLSMREKIRLLEPGEKRSFEVEVKNVSPLSWNLAQNNYPIQLGNHWLDQAGHVVVQDDGRVRLTEELAPGEITALTLTITAPQTPGKYYLELDMVQELVSWFKDKGSHALKIPVLVSNNISMEEQHPKDPIRPEKIILQNTSSKIETEQLIDMHCIARDEVLNLLRTSGGRILECQPDQMSGEYYASYTYYVTKDPESATTVDDNILETGKTNPELFSEQEEVSVAQTKLRTEDKKAIFTIVSKNYLAYARTFCKSVRKFHPDADLYVLLVDEVEDKFNPANELFNVVTLRNLDNIPNPEHLYFKYDVMELNTAVKPYFFSYLFEKYGYKKILYFDPDIVLFDSLDNLWGLLDKNSIVLTPHLTEPYQDDRRPNEIDINLSGVYNLGFIGVANTQSSEAFLEWWQKRLYDFCASEVHRGLFTDQRWVNFAPTMFDGVFILKDPTYNIAYWNLHYRARHIRMVEQQLWYDSRPVAFFHFSGFDSDNLDQLSKHQNRYRLSDLPNLLPLFEYYRAELIANGHSECKKWGYALDYFENGVRIPPIARKIYRDLGGMSLYFGNPYDTSGFGNFYTWLKREMVLDDKPGQYPFPMTNLLGRIYLLNPNLQRAFPQPTEKDARGLTNWFRADGVNHYKLSPEFIKPAIQHASSNQQKYYSGKRVGAEPFGVNIAGYLAGQFGNGQTARANIEAIKTTDVSHVLNNVAYWGHNQENHHQLEYSEHNPYGINLIHVNADTTPVFYNIAGQNYFDKRYNIGLWWWELEKFPERWHKYFKYFQEIWTQSNFCRDSIAAVSPIPVTMIPHVVYLNTEGIIQDKSRFNIPEDTYTFLFSYDFYSVFERKNPLAVIQAFKEAFGARKDTLLIIKSINDHVAPEKMKLLLDTAQGLNVRFMKDHLSRKDMLSLIASSDSYVSLHRSEGFGQGMAEAMYLGKPVIATAYSGNMDFMTPQNSYLVNYQMVELARSYGPYDQGNSWAEPDPIHAAELMTQVVNNQQEAVERGRIAADDIRRNHNHEVVGKQIAQRLYEISGLKREEKFLSKTVPVAGKANEQSGVDIVIPIYSQAELVERCINSVLATTDNSQIILVDDCSPGMEIRDLILRFGSHPRIKSARTPENQGFIGACKLGASLGNAPFILFLNSDTEAIKPGWLEEMHPKKEDVAIVGAQLQYPPDLPGPLAGTIQHAGVARNDQGLPYHPFLGWSKDAQEANITRDVNAVTGACFLIRRAVWNELGGWDERFGKGVYEDVDLCWQARQRGYRVLYQPAAQLYHRESASKAPGGQHQLNAHTRENLKKLQEKWGSIPGDEELFFDERVIKRWSKARQYLQRAVVAIKNNNLKTAETQLKKAVEEGPELPEALLGYAKVLSMRNKHAASVEYLKKTLHVAPAHWDTRLQLVAELYELQKLDQARVELGHLAAALPEDPAILQWQKRLGVEMIEPAQSIVHPNGRAQLILESILTADDLEIALEQNAQEITPDLLDLVVLNSLAARQDGEFELAEGLDALAEYIREFLNQPEQAKRNGHTAAAHPAVALLEELLAAEDILAALEANSSRIDAHVLDLVQRNSASARQDGELELADGMQALADWIADFLEDQVAIPAALPAGD